MNMMDFSKALAHDGVVIYDEDADLVRAMGGGIGLVLPIPL
jgi:hypothetical protein